MSTANAQVLEERGKSESTVNMGMRDTEEKKEGAKQGGPLNGQPVEDH